MKELLRTNDPVLISFAQSLLKDAGIEHHVFDTNMSIADGSLGVIPRRLMVDPAQIGRARNLLIEAGIGDESM